MIDTYLTNYLNETQFTGVLPETIIILLLEFVSVELCHWINQFDWHRLEQNENKADGNWQALLSKSSVCVFSLKAFIEGNKKVGKNQLLRVYDATSSGSSGGGGGGNKGIKRYRENHYSYHVIFQRMGSSIWCLLTFSRCISYRCVLHI